MTQQYRLWGAGFFILLGTLLFQNMTQTRPTITCPVDYIRQNDLCLPPTVGNSFGTRFGILYSLWHCPFAADNPAHRPIYDISEILRGKENWGPLGAWHWWNKPADNYYCLSRNDDVLRHHAILLRDAGIDFVYLDASNHPDAVSGPNPQEMINKPYEALLRVWSMIPGAPRVVPFAPLTKTSHPILKSMMETLAKYPHMQFLKDGKPFFLIAANPALPIDEGLLETMSPSFSIEKMWIPTGAADSPWSFMSWCQNLKNFKASGGTSACKQPFKSVAGTPEQVSISPAFNYFLMSDPNQSVPRYEGKTFARQFATLFQNPKMKYATISSWNEWTAIHFCKRPDGQMSTNPAECPQKPYGSFVDSYSPEYSRDMEPSTFAGDRYYRLMKACIANFRQGLACDEISFNDVGSVPLGASVQDTLSRACSYPATETSKKLFWRTRENLLGRVGLLSQEKGRIFLNGWACKEGSGAPVDVEVYLGGPKGKGVLQAQVRADLASEDAVAQICKDSSSMGHRFKVDVTDLIGGSSGRRLYVHAKSRLSSDVLLEGSGHCTVPWNESENFETISPPPPPPPPSPDPTTPSLFTMQSAFSNDVEMPASLAIDRQTQTAYSSQAFPSSANTRKSFVAAWLDQSHSVSKVILSPRLLNGSIVGFATSYDVYLTSADNSQWNFIGSYTVNISGPSAMIDLGTPRQTHGVLVIPKVLKKDERGLYRFQLSEINLAP